MATADMNTVNLIGRLTRDPELRNLPSGTTLCEIRLAFSTTRKNNASGEWEEKSNFVDVTAFSGMGEAIHRYMSKGSQVAVTGRLDFQEWEKDGAKRSKLVIIASAVQFVGGKGSSDGDSGSGAQRSSSSSSAGSGMGDDDIPF